MVFKRNHADSRYPIYYLIITQCYYCLLINALHKF